MNRARVLTVLYLWQRLVDAPVGLSPDEVLHALRERDEMAALDERGTLKLAHVNRLRLEALDRRLVDPNEAQRILSGLRGLAWQRVVEARAKENRKRPWWWVDVRANMAGVMN